MIDMFQQKHILFVDDDRNMLNGVRRVFHSVRDVWDVDFAVGGREALDLMAAKPFDMVIADMQMPGMSGSELLSIVWRLYPRVIRFALSGRADKEIVLKAAGLSHQFFVKPYNAELLKSEMIKVFHFQDLVRSDPMQKLVTTVEALPVLPEHRAALVGALEKPGASAGELAAIAETDIAIAAKVFHLARWDYFDPRHCIRNIERAVQYLGIDFLRNVVLSTGLFTPYDEETMRMFDLRGLFAHSAAVSKVAEEMARTLSPVETVAEDARTAGLLHDIGKLVLVNGCEDEYWRIVQKHRATRTPLHILEREELGATHAEVGGALMILWGLPAHIVEAVTFHHKPQKTDLASYDTVMSVHMADCMDHAQAEEGAPPRDGRAQDAAHVLCGAGYGGER